ncbi:YpoC family protein [Microbacteriaceae bacterium 4G12]
MTIHVIIPPSFLQAPFFIDEAQQIAYNEAQSFLETMENGYFVYDILTTKEAVYEPWNDQEITIPAAFQMWKQEKEKIALLFRERKRKEARQPMIQFIAHLISVLHWMNGTPVVTLHSIKEELECLALKPVNVSERMTFIMEQPDHYHSFIQLSELYEEVEKLFTKMMIMQKKTSPNQ